MTTLDLIGADGSVWHLTDQDSPAHLLGGMGGLHLAAGTNRWTQTARRSGRTWKDVVTDSRKFTMNVRVGDAIPPYRTGDDWRALDGQFWSALAYDAPATLVFGDRTLAFRLDDDNEHDYPKDPSLLGKAIYSIACIADRPEWLGPEVSETFSLAPPPVVDYYQGGTGPPFVISPAGLTSASVANHGDLPAYPRWHLTGPATTTKIGVGDRLLTIPFPLLAGQEIFIDTESQTILDKAGASYWPQMGSTPIDFAPIPPGGQVPISLYMQDPTDISQIEISLTPRYRRAWGGGSA